MTQHTPGPWGTKELTSVVSIQNQSHPVYPDTIASVFKRDPNGNAKHPWEANARLIAAAPDLLAACQAVAQPFEDAADWKDAIGRLQGLARAAIEKAGQSYEEEEAEEEE